MHHSSIFPATSIATRFSIILLLGITIIIFHNSSLSSVDRGQPGLNVVPIEQVARNTSSSAAVLVVPKEEKLSSSITREKEIITLNNNNGNHDNDRVCVIHVGPHKTGTTALQNFLFANPASKFALKRDKYKFPIFHISRTKDHAKLASCLPFEKTLRHSRCHDEEERNVTLEYFQSFVNDSASNGYNILLSSEELDRPLVNITELTSYLVPKYKIHVVVYYRRFYNWIYSLYNQIIKNHKHIHSLESQHLTFVDWLTSDILKEYYQDLYSVNVYNRYREAPGIFDVSVVNMHKDPNNFNTNVMFSCNHLLDTAPHLCELARQSTTLQKNLSISLDWRVFRNNIKRYHSIRLSDLDKVKLEKVKWKFNGMADIPKVCLSPDLKETLFQISLESEKALTSKKWYNSEEGLEDLKSDFDEKINSKLCSMDIKKILTSPEWQNFLTKLAQEGSN